MKKYILTLWIILSAFSFVSADNYCDVIRYWKLYASDWTYLWILTNNYNDPESIANSFGKYWSEFQTKSIFNEFWTYWSEFQTKSPRNEFATATSVPRIYKWDWYRYLSINEFIPSSLNTFDVVTCFISPFDERLKPFKDLDNNRLLYIQEWSCQSEFWTNSTVWDDRWKCKCKNWYKRNQNWTSCIPMTEDEKCIFEFWSYAYSPEPWYCNCINWYQRSSDRSYCVKTPTTTTTTTTTNYTVTPAATSSNTTVNCDTYWPNAYSVNNKCECKDTYEWNYSKNYCVAARNHPLYYWTDFRSAKDGWDYINMLLDFEDTVNACTSEFWINSYEWSDKLCYCKDWYARNKEKTSCVSLTESCVSYFWKHSVWDPTNSDNCLCESWYVFNSDNTECIESNGVNNSSYSNNYSTEFNNAYQFAFNNKITTMPSIEEANMNWEIIRAEIAKMLANWVKSLGRTPDASKSCSFKDISWVQWDLNTAIIEACQLGIMWQWITEFRPFDKITKWEVSTAVSRIIRGNKNDWWDPFYWKHMNALKDAWVIPDLSNPEINEIRWNVMVTLMKASGTEELLSCDDPAVILACSLDDPSCPNKCLEK